MTLASIIESILFVHGEPMALKKLASLARVSEDDAASALDELAHHYADRGLVLIKKDTMYQLGSHPENAMYIEALVKDEFSAELSRSSLETIAIIAYKGPLTRVEIDHIRGVNSSFALRTLLMRGLIEREENPKDNRAYQYRVSMNFLKHLGLTSMADLPEYEELKTQSATPPEEPSQES